MENEDNYSEDDDDEDNFNASSENSDTDLTHNRSSNEINFGRESIKHEDTETNEHVIVEITHDGAFGRFNEELGFGSFKRVYRGFDFNTAREVAWNVIDVLNTEEQNLRKISEEIHIMQKLKHPNIIQFNSGWYDQDKKQVIIITELLPGGSLKQHLSRFKAPRLRLIKTWIKEILKGLKYLHEENKPQIVHRDIKCDNIFIDKTTGGVKIGDLGRSELLLCNYATTYAGTEEFMAPEVHEGKYTVKADIYSLGMCILEMITLEKPYKECDNAIMNIYENIKEGIMPRSLDKIADGNLIQLIKTCLKREHERPTAAELLCNPYLNETDSEENNHPVLVNQDEHVQNDDDYRPTTVKKTLYADESNSNNSQEDIGKEVDMMDITNPNNCAKSKKHSSSTKSAITTEPSLIFDHKNHHVSLYNPMQLMLNSERANSGMLPGGPLNICNIGTKLGIPLYPTGKGHRVSLSLKNSISHNQKESIINISISKFEVTIVKKFEKDISNRQTLNLKSQEENNMIPLIFFLNKKTWKKRKHIECVYDLINDTIEGVGKELQREINLTEEEYQIVSKKLTDFVSKYKSSEQNLSIEQKSSIEAGASTTPEVDISLKKKKTYENFYTAYNKLMNKIHNLLQHENTQKIEKLKKIYDARFTRNNCVEIVKMIEDYNKKLEILQKITSRTNI